MPGSGRGSPARWRGPRLVKAERESRFKRSTRLPLHEKAAGNLRPPPPPKLHPRSVIDYVLQQPEPLQSEPQQFWCSTVATPVGHSSTQHSHGHAAQSQVPVSQQLQQSHTGQPKFWLPSSAAPKGRRPNAAQRKKPFIGKPSLYEDTESITPRHDA